MQVVKTDEIVINLNSTQEIGATVETAQYDICVTPKQRIGADVSAPQYNIDLKSQVKTVTTPYRHDQLDGLDYESSGHTGFASKPFVEQYAVPFRLAGLPSTTGFRQGGSVYVDNGTSGFKMSLTALKELNTKIVTTDDINNVDMSKLTVGDFIYERKD